MENKDKVTLKEIVEKFPIQKGISEIIAYIDIANDRAASSIDSKAEINIHFKSRNHSRGSVELDDVIFKKMHEKN